MNPHGAAGFKNLLQNAKESLAEQVLAEDYNIVVEVTANITKVTQVFSAVS